MCPSEAAAPFPRITPSRRGRHDRHHRMPRPCPAPTPWRQNPPRARAPTARPRHSRAARLPRDDPPRRSRRRQFQRRQGQPGHDHPAVSDCPPRADDRRSRPAHRGRVAGHDRAYREHASRRRAADARPRYFRQVAARQHRGTGPLPVRIDPMVYELAKTRPHRAGSCAAI